MGQRPKSSSADDEIFLPAKNQDGRGTVSYTHLQLAITVCSCGTLAIVSEIWGIIEGVRLLQGTIDTDGYGMKFVD